MNDDQIRNQIRGTNAERALLAAEGAGGGSSNNATATALGIDERAAMRAWNELIELGLGHQVKRLSGGYTVSEKGITIARSIHQSRVSGPERWDAVQRAVAQVLIADGRINAPFADALGQVDGTSVTEVEARNAIAKLERWELINVIRADQGTVVALVDDPVHQVPGIEGLLIDYFEGRVGAVYDNSTTTTFGDGNNVGAFQAGGQNNTQTATVSIDVDTQAKVLTQVGALLHALDQADGDVADLRGAVQEIADEAARDGATKASLKERVIAALLVAGATETGALVSQGLAQLLGLVSQ